MANPGQPTKYRPEYCDLLKDHFRQGGSMESFGAKCGNGVSIQTVYNWLEAHPEFLEARKAAEPLRHTFYEEMAKAMATGQLKRLKAERPMLNAQGQPIPDGRGGFLMEREWEPAMPAQAVFIFLTKNMLGWRDKKDIEHHGGENPDGTKKAIQVEGRFAALSKAEVEARYKELLKEALLLESGEDK